MIKVFYTEREKFTSSTELLKKILNERFSVFKYEIFKNENGKPFLRLNSSYSPLFFSVSHTKTAYFIAFSDENIGIDAEQCSRQTDYVSILRNFPESERSIVKNTLDFLRLWTAKESTIKWLGGTIAKDLKKLSYLNETITFNELELPLQITQTIIFEHIVSVCAERRQSLNFEKL